MSGPIALVGSGEYLPVMQELEGKLLAGRPPKYVQVPTAAAEEGPDSLDRWVALGRAQAERLSVESVPLVVRDRDEADDPALAALVEGAGLVYLSGGSPSYLATTLRGTRVWAAIVAAWESGAALAGCSAGAMAMTGWAPFVRDLTRVPDPGLGILPSWRVIPHFDLVPVFDPTMVDRAIAQLDNGSQLFGIDEETALVNFGEGWEVHGRQAVWTLSAEGRTPYRAGEPLPF